MHGSNAFDAAEFAGYLRARRSVFLLACGVALVVSLAVSLALPKRYMAKSSILIEAPAGGDPRAATAVSGVYLESLKTYESFAASDTVFQRATERLGLDVSKNSVLKVSRPGNTTVLEIGVTLPDPRKAQALAQLIAEQTIEVSRTIDAKSSDAVNRALRDQVRSAQERLAAAGRERAAFVAANPIEALESELREGSAFEYRLEPELARARADLAGSQQAVPLQASLAAIESQRRDVAAALQKNGEQLDVRKSRRDQLEEEERSARAAYEETTGRLNATLASPYYLGERLRLIDPGVVPRQPVLPNIPLNVIASFLAALVAAFIYLAVRFGYVRMERERSERAYSLR